MDMENILMVARYEMGVGEMGEEVRVLRSINRYLQKIKYSIENEVAKEPIHMTHGHEQWWGGLPE